MSIPFAGKEFTLNQPDGTQLKVKGWGDQYHAVFQTLDGFTVVQDPVSGFYQYAQLSSDHEDLKPTGVRPGAVDPTLLGLAPGARVTRAAALAKAREHPGMPPGTSRWEQRRKQMKERLRMVAMSGGASLATLRIGAAIFGLGMGIANTPVVIAVQTSVGFSQRGVATAGHHGRHEQRRANRCAAACDKAPSAPLPGWSRPRVQAEQRSDLLSVEASKLGLFGKILYSLGKLLVLGFKLC